MILIIRTCATSKRERKAYDSTGVPQCSLHKLFEWVLSLAIPTAAILAQRCRWVQSWCFYHFIFNKEQSWRLLPLFFFQFMDLEFGEKHATWFKFWLWLGSIPSFWAQDTHPLSLLLWLKIIVGYCTVSPPAILPLVWLLSTGLCGRIWKGAEVKFKRYANPWSSVCSYWLLFTGL